MKILFLFKHPLYTPVDLALKVVAKQIGVTSITISDDRTKIEFEVTPRSEYNLLRTRNILQEIILKHMSANDKIIDYSEMYTYNEGSSTDGIIQAGN